MLNYCVSPAKEVTVPDTYKQYIADNICHLQTLLKSNSNSSMELQNKTSQFGQFYPSCDTISRVNKLIAAIQDESLQSMFRSTSQSQWVDTEKQLAECVSHISQYQFIGLDLEYHGTSFEVRTICD